MVQVLVSLVALAWSANLPPGSAVSLHSRLAGVDSRRASAARSDGGQTLSLSATLGKPQHSSSTSLALAVGGEGVAAFERVPAPPMRSRPSEWQRLRGGGFLDKAKERVSSGIVNMWRGWLRNGARDPIVYFLGLALWRDLRLLSNQTASCFDQTASCFEKVFKKLDPLVDEKDQRGLAASKALLLPDQDQGRTNCFFIRVFLPRGLPDLESRRFHLDVIAGPKADPAWQQLQLTYTNGPLRQTWCLEVPNGMVVDAAELASFRWSFEVEESDPSPIVRLALRRPLANRDGAPGGSPPSSTGPRPPEPSAPPPPKFPAATARRTSEGRAG